jgi:hypothetical protein
VSIGWNGGGIFAFSGGAQLATERLPSRKLAKSERRLRPVRRHMPAVKESAEMATHILVDVCSVGRLPYSVGEQQLRQLFATFGEVVEDRTREEMHGSCV